MTHVVVVGSANVDMIAQTPHIPQPGETILGRNFSTALGGKGANQAVGAARLGAKVTFIARVGQDALGDQCLSGYESEGINTDFVIRDPEAPTGVALIAVSDDGENSIIVASGSNMRLTPQDVEAAAHIFQDADTLLLQLEVPLETVQTAAEIARRYGVRVILNPAPAQKLSADLLHLVDVITPNRIELAQIAGLSDHEELSHEQLAKSALGIGPTSAVITLGSQGALAAGSWGWVHVPAYVVQTVDTTAAGDAFNAGLAVALGQENTSLEQATRYACACGALAATKLGAQLSLPYYNEVYKLMEQ
jgi:ribokinase